MKLIRRDFDAGYFAGPLYGSKVNSHRDRRRLSEVVRHKPAGRLLEIGSGTGTFLQLAQQHFEVEGVEISPHAVAGLQRALRTPVRQADIQLEPLPVGRYDVVVAFNVLEHLQQPPLALERIAASLVGDGVLIGSVPLNAGLLGRIQTVLSNLFDRTHVSTPPPERWRTWFLHAGFETIELFGEFLAGPHRSWHVRGPFWRYLSFNLMFVCRTPQ